MGVSSHFKANTLFLFLEKEYLISVSDCRFFLGGGTKTQIVSVVSLLLGYSKVITIGSIGKKKKRKPNGRVRLLILPGVLCEVHTSSWDLNFSLLSLHPSVQEQASWSSLPIMNCFAFYFG